MTTEILVLTGSLCLTLALIEAWILVIMFSTPDCQLTKFIPGAIDLLKSHIDYLMMSMFLFIFYLLFSHFRLTPSAFVLGCVCLGSLGNPALFFIRALKPGLKAEPTLLFRMLMGVSCLLTTIGYLLSTWLIARSAINLM